MAERAFYCVDDEVVLDVPVGDGRSETFVVTETGYVPGDARTREACETYAALGLLTTEKPKTKKAAE